MRRILNEQRLRAVHVSRAFKTLLATRGGLADAALVRILRPILWLLLRPFLGVRWAYVRVFMSDGAVRHHARAVLADLRDYCFATTSAFDPDPIIMARRQGRRDVWLRIQNYLNLDEQTVQLFMEIDDGIGG